MRFKMDRVIGYQWHIKVRMTWYQFGEDRRRTDEIHQDHLGIQWLT